MGWIISHIQISMKNPDGSFFLYQGINRMLPAGGFAPLGQEPISWSSELWLGSKWTGLDDKEYDHLC
jgi:hypothetical protein